MGRRRHRASLGFSGLDPAGAGVLPEVLGETSALSLRDLISGIDRRIPIREMIRRERG